MKRLLTFVVGSVFVTHISPILDSLTERVVCQIQLSTLKITQEAHQIKTEMEKISESKTEDEDEDIVITGFQPEK